MAFNWIVSCNLMQKYAKMCVFRLSYGNLDYNNHHQQRAIIG